MKQKEKTSYWAKRWHITAVALLAYCVTVIKPPDTQTVVPFWAVVASHLLLLKSASKIPHVYPHPMASVLNPNINYHIYENASYFLTLHTKLIH